jgi:hypothetical protein
MATQFSHVIDFDEHNDLEVKGQILSRTRIGYERTLFLFDRFCELHPQAVSPPNIKTLKAFMEWVGLSKKGRLAERPTVDTMEGFRRDFATAWSWYRKSTISDVVLKTIKAASYILFLAEETEY